MTHSVAFVDNDATLLVTGLRSRTGALVDYAVVTLQSLVDARTGVAVTGISLPVTLTSTGQGNYEVLLPRTAGFVAGRSYYATIRAVAAGVQAEWRETILAKLRVA